MYVIAICNVVLIRYALNDTKAALQALCKPIGRRLHRSAIYGITDVLSSFPFIALVIQLLHHFQSELLAFWRSVGLAKHSHAHLT